MGTWHVYVVRCGDDTYYCGSTNDLARRMREHNSSPKGARYTKSRRPVILVYSEALGSRSLALRREARIKALPRRAKQALFVQGSPISSTEKYIGDKT
jgi:putative endonuclease